MINYSALIRQLKGKRVPRPNRIENGTLSGHAAGEPFEKETYRILKKTYLCEIFKQHEFLNDLFLRNTRSITIEQKHKLFDSPTAFFLLSRSDAATKKWSENNLFEEKQNDIADILYIKDGFYNIIDVKTRNVNKNAQSPNIISAFKLAQMCAYMIDNDDYLTVNIDYIQIDWCEQSKHDYLECVNAYHANLFKVDPNSLYINWAAAMQIQFHVNEVDQTFIGTKKEWCYLYIKHFVASANMRISNMREKFIKPFIKYIQ